MSTNHVTPFIYSRPLTCLRSLNRPKILSKQSEQMQERECLVLPPIEEGGRLGLIINYENGMTQNEFFSHRVKTSNGDEHNVRLMVKIRVKETNAEIDPLDFRYHNGAQFFLSEFLSSLHLVCIYFFCNAAESLGCHQAIKPDGSWHDVKFDGHCYITGKGHVFNDRDIQSKEYIHYAENFEVDFPSIVFVYLPDDGKALYDRIKVMSNL